MAAVLTWVTTTKRAALGFVYLFTFSLGMCTLLVVVGLFSGAAASGCRRAGSWMVWVKRGFALVMLGVAEYYLIEMGKLLFDLITGLFAAMNCHRPEATAVTINSPGIIGVGCDNAVAVKTA